ncbi:MAG: alpha-L-rhamnosidase [Kiritimatiellae bacterium]|nr:alpha-L-rhamnosidase [Kiritimatiellia bacterium]
MTTRSIRLAAIWTASSILTAAALTPEGMMVDLASKPGLATIYNETPAFSWCYPIGAQGERQTAYQIQVATTTSKFRAGTPDLWDSGKVTSANSLSIPYQGAALPTSRDICWRVRAWDQDGKEGSWSETLSFRTAGHLEKYRSVHYPLTQRHVSPQRLFTNSVGHVVLDFGKAAFGWLELLPPMSMENGGDFIFHIGEKLDGDQVDRKPGGTIRYAKVSGALTTPGIYRVPFIADKRNTTGGAEGGAIKLPKEIGVIMPFRYVEVEACPYAMGRSLARMIAVNYPMDRKAAAFVSNDPALDQIYRFCSYSILATSFAGVYVDGDRERIPYEADAYINQLGHYAVDREYTMARYSHDYLMAHPTWPTEWKQHSIMMAWTDWMWTGDTYSLRHWYDKLKNEKLLSQFARNSDGLLVTKGDRSTKGTDIVDWPPNERDGFEFRPVNAVINAFYCLNLRQMAEIATVLGKTDDAVAFTVRAEQVKKAFHAAFYQSERECYVDGEGAKHASLHANLFPLAFGIVPEKNKEQVAQFCLSRGMACSPYAAQYLLEALFESGHDEDAIRLMTRTDDRGWISMMRQGSTITMEAWGLRYKGNQDWNHAWGSAPLNAISRYVMGVRPLEAGFGKILIQPQIGSLRAVEGIVPTIRGQVRIGVRQTPRKEYRLSFAIPANTTAEVSVPAIASRVLLDGKVQSTTKINERYSLPNIASGAHVVLVTE